MKRKLYKLISLFLTTGILVGSPLLVHAQSDYPNKPIRLIIGFPAGGSTDIVGRVVAQKLGERLGQTIVVENKGGAGGTIGTDAAAKAAPDGYTLTLGTTSTMAVAPSAYSKLGYDPIKSFAPISLVAVTPYLLVVNPQVPANSLAELVVLAKSQPGKLNFASAGNGSTTQLAMEMLNDVTGMKMTHIPYKGNADADLAIVSNQVQVLFGSMPALLQHAKSNKLRALAVVLSVRQHYQRPLPLQNWVILDLKRPYGWEYWLQLERLNLLSIGLIENLLLLRQRLILKQRWTKMARMQPAIRPNNLQA
jgi:tripartite-type tricarboxylate transporter receptor subunit TctC